MDIVFINDYRVETRVGIYPWEQGMEQTVQLDLEIGIPAGLAARTGKIADTVDYGAVVKRIGETLEDRHYPLLERLAEEVAQLVLAEFGASWVKLSVAKLGALRGVKRLGVTIERSREKT